MTTYIRKPKQFNCEQFVKHPHKGDFEITKIHGVTGYGAKVGYIHTDSGNMITVRPSDWVLQESGATDYKVLTEKQFSEDYVLHEPLAKTSKTSDTKKANPKPKVEDNSVI